MDQVDLKKAGLKATVPRIRILEIQEHNDQRHLRAEDVYRVLLDAGEDVGLAIVYRVLTQFEAAGLVVRHHFEGPHSVFELDKAGTMITWFSGGASRIEQSVDAIIEKRQRRIAEKAGFSRTDLVPYIYGVCPKCRDS